MKNLKTQVPKMTGQPGFKWNEHTPEWVNAIASAIKAGTSAAIKAYRNPISYHGVPPKWEDNAPLAPRPVTEIAEPTDIETGESATADLTRKIDPAASVPLHPAMLAQMHNRR